MKKSLFSFILVAMLIVPTMAYARGGFSSGGHASFSSGSRSSFSSSRPSISLSKPSVSSSSRVSSGSSKSTISSRTTGSRSTISSGRSGYSGGTANYSTRRTYVSGGRTYMYSPSGHSVYVVNSGHSGGFWSHAAAFGAGTFVGNMMHPTGYAYVPSSGGAPVYSGGSFMAGLLDFFLFCLVILVLGLLVKRLFFAGRRYQ